MSSASKPAAYKTGQTTFFGRQFLVSPDVLIPRSESEMIIDEVRIFYPTIFDIGTGSGCLAISLAKIWPGAKIIASDVSASALDVARKNAARHNVKIDFIKTSLLADITEKPDLVVANLPYIPSARIPTLDSSVKDFEPIIALDGGPDGFGLYRQLFTQIRNHQLFPKLILCEIDDTHRQIALAEARHYFPTAKTTVKMDFSNFDRLLRIDFI